MSVFHLTQGVKSFLCVTFDYSADFLPKTAFQTNSIWFGIADKILFRTVDLKLRGTDLINNLVKTIDPLIHIFP